MRKHLNSIVRVLPKAITAPIFFWNVRKTIKATITAIESKHNEGTYPKGINVFGNIKSSVGLGQQARIIAEPLLKKNVKLCAVNSSSKSYPENENLAKVNFVSEPIYSCNLVTLSIQKFAQNYHKVLQDNNFFYGRYNIAYVAWEWNKYPTSWIPLTNKFNEFWAMSSFVKEAAEKSLNIPVLLMPYAIDFPKPKNLSKKHFIISENKFIFMFSYDFFSNFYRKNPLAVIQAFRIAFPKNHNIELVIKVSMLEYSISHKIEMKKLRSFIGDDTRIKIIDKVLSNDEMKGLLNLCDVYVSLHRAEGFGLGMAESMKLGKAVIATNYSGNNDFTKKDTACLVGYKLVDVKPSESLYYEKGQVWAEPYVEEAAEHMKKLYQDKVFYKKIAKSGQEFIDEHYNNQIVGKRFVNRLKDVGVL